MSAGWNVFSLRERGYFVSFDSAIKHGDLIEAAFEVAFIGATAAEEEAVWVVFGCFVAR